MCRRISRNAPHPTLRRGLGGRLCNCCLPPPPAQISQTKTPETPLHLRKPRIRYYLCMSTLSPVFAGNLQSPESAPKACDLGEVAAQGSTALKLNPLEYSEYVRRLWPTPSPSAFAAAPVHMDIYAEVHKTGLPNYLHARIPVPSDLKCDIWDEVLKEYDDSQITQFLRYGWPSSYTAPTPPTPSTKNHPSASAYMLEVDRFVKKEVEKSALIGPFAAPPFTPWTQTSPIMTVPKPESSRRRVIIDLSYPAGGSVNDGVARNFFQGRSLTYTLPSAKDLADRLVHLGPGAFMWKADLERAYRQLRSDPLDYPLMGIRHGGGILIDVCPSFGCRGSSAAQQRVSRAVCYLMEKAGHHVMAYVDDFTGAAASFQESVSAFAEFEGICSRLGLKLAPEKCSFPTTSMEWLGFHYDSVSMQVTIPQKKLGEVVDLARVWSFKKKATRRELQSLAGKLMFISQCVMPARKFMARVLAALRAAPHEGQVPVGCELRRDVKWFVDYAAACNHRLLLPPTLPRFHIECDACMDGARGFSDTEYYSYRFPQSELENRHISQLEATNIVCAIKTLVPPSLCYHEIVVTTDNSASVYAINTGQTRDYVLAACAREVWLQAALQQLDITIRHAPGITLELADALSRRYKDPSFEHKAVALVTARNLTCVPPVKLSNVFNNYL